MIRNDFVSNSSSSSFIIDRESWDKATGGDTFGLDYDTYTLYGICDYSSYYLDINLGPWLMLNNFRLDEFKVIPDKKWIDIFMQTAVNGYVVPESLKDYIPKFKEIFFQYSMNRVTSSDVYKKVKEPYIKDVIDKIIKPNVPDMELIHVSGDDHEQSDPDYDNDEDKVRSICWDISSKGTKFFRADTAH